MAHLVETMMYVGKAPWHGLGKKIPEGQRLTVREAIATSGLDSKVDLRPLFAEGPKNEKLEVLEQYAVCRRSDNKVLGIVGPDYVPLQNKDAFEWFQPFLDSGNATIETAGSIKRGKQVWVLAKIRAGEITIGDADKIANYILLSNSHDGSISVKVGFTPIRVVCNNTLSMAHESKASKLLKVRHTARLLENLESIREIMDLADREFYATMNQYRALMKRKIDRSDLQRYVRIVFSLPDKGGNELVPNIMHLFDHGRGSDMAGRTYWGAYNAVNEYLNYFRGRTQDNTLSSLWFGDSARINKTALSVAMEMAA